MVQYFGPTTAGPTILNNQVVVPQQPPQTAGVVKDDESSTAQAMRQWQAEQAEQVLREVEVASMLASMPMN